MQLNGQTGMRFLAIGECMAELAPTTTPGEYRLGFAGDTFNTAWYLARLRPGLPVSFCTAVGTDAISQQMRDALSASGISDRHVRSLPDSSVGLYLITLDNGERSFSYWRGQSAARRLAEDPGSLDMAIRDVNFVHFSGITLAILDASARKTLFQALRAARAEGKTIAFDPNLRPSLWSEASDMTEAIMQGAAVSDILLPSFEDEADWFGDADPAATANRYTAVGATTVVVKNGAAPVHYIQGTARGEVAVPPLPSVVDTTAAGDSFNAAIFAGLEAGQSLPDSISLACRLAGEVVRGKGALVPVDFTNFGG